MGSQGLLSPGTSGCPPRLARAWKIPGAFQPEAPGTAERTHSPLSPLPLLLRAAPAQPESSLSPMLSPEASGLCPAPPEAPEKGSLRTWVGGKSPWRVEEVGSPFWGAGTYAPSPAGAAGVSHGDPTHTHFSDSSFYWGQGVPFRGGQQHSPSGVGCFEDMQCPATTTPAHGMRVTKVPTWAAVTPSLPQGKGLLQTDWGVGFSRVPGGPGTVQCLGGIRGPEGPFQAEGGAWLRGQWPQPPPHLQYPV